MPAAMSQGRAPVGSVAQPDCRKRTSERIPSAPAQAPGALSVFSLPSQKLGAEKEPGPPSAQLAAPLGAGGPAGGVPGAPTSGSKRVRNVTRQGQVWFCLQFVKLL